MRAVRGSDREEIEIRSWGEVARVRQPRSVMDEMNEMNEMNYECRRDLGTVAMSEYFALGSQVARRSEEKTCCPRTFRSEQRSSYFRSGFGSEHESADDQATNCSE